MIFNNPHCTSDFDKWKGTNGMVGDSSSLSPFVWQNKIMWNKTSFSVSQDFFFPDLFFLAEIKLDIRHTAMKKLHKSLEMWNVLILELIFSKARIPEKGKIAFKWQVTFSPALKPAGLNMRVQSKGSQQTSGLESDSAYLKGASLCKSSTVLSLENQSSPTLAPFISLLHPSFLLSKPWEGVITAVKRQCWSLGISVTVMNSGLWHVTLVLLIQKCVCI